MIKSARRSKYKIKTAGFIKDEKILIKKSVKPERTNNSDGRREY